MSSHRKWWVPDARGWIAIGIYGLSVMLLWMMKADAQLRGDEFFQTIATVIISNGLMAIVAWAFSATKGGGEQAASNAVIAEKLATASMPKAEPQKVEVVQPPENPVPTLETGASDELPEYAR